MNRPGAEVNHLARTACRPGGGVSGWLLASWGPVSWVPGCRVLEVLGELGPCSRAHVDHRPVRVPGVPDGDQCVAGPDLDAVSESAAVSGFSPVHL